MDAQLLWFVSRSSGVVALALLTASLTLGIVTAGRAGGAMLPRAAVLRLHRNLALLTVVFVVAHIATAIAVLFFGMVVVVGFLILRRNLPGLHR